MKNEMLITDEQKSEVEESKPEATITKISGERVKILSPEEIEKNSKTNDEREVRRLGRLGDLKKRITDSRYRKGYSNASDFLKEKGKEISYHGIDESDFERLIISMFTEGTEDDLEMINEIARKYGDDTLIELRNELRVLARESENIPFITSVTHMTAFIDDYNHLDDPDPQLRKRIYELESLRKKK